MNYFSVIRPPAGQITQPQSCAFLHGVDWKWTTLGWRSLPATRGWPTQNGTTPLDPSRLVQCREVLLAISILLRCSGDFAVWCSLSWERDCDKNSNSSKPGIELVFTELGGKRTTTIPDGATSKGRGGS
ncbi:hypothetical protein AVEN_203995-1 [Araneus ventricosus]|uniref:Uncharacterized protein n=1 Tax=Araneus ventricosus TaxID=182803 RepID=A0A4Y2P432_ARAVE|nr:hypothetical protein AVEN_203995-1 [Araneus ventricosus]